MKMKKWRSRVSWYLTILFLKSESGLWGQSLNSENVNQIILRCPQSLFIWFILAIYTFRKHIRRLLLFRVKKLQKLYKFVLMWIRENAQQLQYSRIFSFSVFEKAVRPIMTIMKLLRPDWFENLSDELSV